MKIFITEKPSVARQFAAALSIPSNKSTDGYIKDGDVIITWAVGHLIQLVQPDDYDPKYKSWNLADLPFLPDEYRYEVIPSMKKQYSIVKKIFTDNYPEGAIIYDCGDSGREGQYIQALIYRQTGSTLPVKRVWIDSQTDEEILRGIREAKPESEYNNLTDAGYMRAIEDYAFGINLSRALTKKFEGEMERRVGKTTISVGRVMTCVLGMVCERQMQIDNFTPTTYYKINAQMPVDNIIEAEWKAGENSRFYNSPILYGDNGILDKKEAEKFIKTLSADPQLTVSDITYKEEKKYAPLLFNLAELQNACSKRFKFTPKHTLEIAQSLYEKKLTTYPRTDARVLSSAIAKEIEKNIKGLSKGGYRSSEAENILSIGSYKKIGNTRYTDDKKITDHYAIIPTGYTNAQLTEEEKNVYHLIIDRFLAIFYPPAVYEVYKAVFVHSLMESFFLTNKVIKEKGFTLILGKEDDNAEEEAPLKNLTKGQIIKSSFILKESKTSAPKPYNSGSIILAMENAGNLIEEEELREQLKGSGIGTSATRADIIDKLVKIGYIKINKKTQIISPDKIGLVVYDIVKRTIPSLLRPKMTANWEMGLSQIEKGLTTKQQYKDVLDNYVRKQVEAIKQMEGEERKEYKEPQIIGKCPICGKNLMLTRLGSYACEDFKNDGTGCFFSVYSSIVEAGGDKLLPLVKEGKPTEIIENIKKKDGTTYNAALSIDLEQRKIVYTFAKSQDDILGKCPKCGGDILKGKFGAYCQNKCGIMGISNYFGKKLTDSQVKRILAGKTVLVKGLHSKAKDVDYNVNIKLKGVVQYTYTSKDGKEKTGYQLEYERSFANDKKALPKSIDAALKEAIQMAKENK